MMTQLNCKVETRRNKVRQTPSFNGLDYLEVSADQLTLTVYFIGKAPASLKRENLRIEGGRRITGIQVLGFDIHRLEDEELDDYMLVYLDRFGDFSPYRLGLVDLDEHGFSTSNPLQGFDSRYAWVTFDFKASCPSDFDCDQSSSCAPEPQLGPKPELGYLARDYASFRRLLLDRLSQTMPAWQETHIPDVGITLVEVMAYVGDYLSYYQDAVATEAYLGTARKRASVRRHARLVDYPMHEGNNARSWVVFHTSQKQIFEQDQVAVIAFHGEALGGALPITWDDLRKKTDIRYEVFEPLLDCGQKDFGVSPAHNEIHFYTWGDALCCLPQGATSATLCDGTFERVEPDNEGGCPPPPCSVVEETEIVDARLLDLKPGDVLIFEEVIGPGTGNPADADRKHRHAVRLTVVHEIRDLLCGKALLEIEWDEADALPFPLCLSAMGPPPACALIENVSVARGNVILMDHGRTYEDEDLGCVPELRTEVHCHRIGRATEPTVVPGPYAPCLPRGPLTFSQIATCRPEQQHPPASRMLEQDPRMALPHLMLKSSSGEDGTPIEWTPQRDLLAGDGDDAHFVVENDNEGFAHLRFGDGETGRRVAPNHCFRAGYRIGNGKAGNLGAETLTQVVTTQKIDGLMLLARNPFAAIGGKEPESLEDVRRFAPHHFRKHLQRAVVAEDYAVLALREFPHQIQRAAATLEWTGSWYKIRLVIDPLDAVKDVPGLLDLVAQRMHRYRRIGHELEVTQARYVALDVELDICVLPDYLRGHVKQALRDVFSNRIGNNGTPGYFHPDSLSFGEGVRLSSLVATARAVVGVENVMVTKFQRLFEGDAGEREAGILALGPLEIARLDNDPNDPENGRLNLVLRGGR